METVYRVYPVADYFEIGGVRLPYLDILADDEEAAARGAKMIAPNQSVEAVKNLPRRNTKYQ